MDGWIEINVPVTTATLKLPLERLTVAAINVLYLVSPRLSSCGSSPRQRSVFINEHPAGEPPLVVYYYSPS